MRCAVVLCAVALAGIAAREGFAAPPDGDAAAIAAADAKILGEIREHSEVMPNLEYLSDSIGARLTGSPLTKQANDWTAAKMKEYGLVNVHLEPWTIAHSWTRGAASARIVAPAVHPLTFASAGWAPTSAGMGRRAASQFDAQDQPDF